MVKLLNHIGHFVAVFALTELQSIVDSHRIDSDAVEEHSTLIILRLIEEAGDCAVVLPSLFPNFPIISAIAVDLERFWGRDLSS